MIILNDIIQGLLLGGLFALFACGLSLMFGVMDVINLAHGDIAVAGVYLAVVLIPATHISALWIFVLVVPVFVVGGYLMQRLIFQPSLDSGAVTTLLVTFGLSIVLENGLLEIFTANSHSLNIGSLVSSSWRLSSQVYVPYLDVVICGTAIVALVCVQLFMARTRTGRLIRAVADDKEAAQLVGADYRHLYGVAAGMAFGTVALAGLALGAYTSIDPTAGPTYLLFGFEAVVIGGLGSLWGTLLGGFVLGVSTTLGSQVDPNFGSMLPNLVFLFVLAVRPRGFFPKKALA
ncbi:MAG: branched-chain amino acid ABC transporter permease [Acidimicrobiales bacterium]